MMINIPNVFRPTPSRKTLTKNLPGQTAVSNTQATDALGEYKSVDRRQQSERRKEKKQNTVDSRADKRRSDDGLPHIDVDA